MELTRRAFLSLVSLATGAVATLTALPARAKKLAFALAKAPALGTVGGAATVTLKGRTVLFVRDGDASLRAVDPTCTHKACAVEYRSDAREFRCPCHGSRFSIEGKVLNGPAPSDLTSFPAELSGDRVVVDLPEDA